MGARTRIRAVAVTQREAVEAILAALKDFGWKARWTWFTSPSAWLSGEIPYKLLPDDPERVVRAAQRFGNNS